MEVCAKRHVTWRKDVARKFYGQATKFPRITDFVVTTKASIYQQGIELPTVLPNIGGATSQHPLLQLTPGNMLIEPIFFSRKLDS